MAWRDIHEIVTTPRAHRQRFIVSHEFARPVLFPREFPDDLFSSTIESRGLYRIYPFYLRYISVQKIAVSTFQNERRTTGEPPSSDYQTDLYESENNGFLGGKNGTR